MGTKEDFYSHDFLKIVLLVIFCYVFLFQCNSVRRNGLAEIRKEVPTATTTSPYSVSISQPDGTNIEIIGIGTMESPYTETVDGYTIMRNKNGVYEYAVQDMNMNLVPGGIKAHNTIDRSIEEIRFLGKITKHLRVIKK
jgi:hypothetical protein